jgi:hypothetical protein
MSQMVITCIIWQEMLLNGLTHHDPNAYEYVSSMNPNVQDYKIKEK